MLKLNRQSTLQSYDAIEVFAGVATLSRSLRAAGYSTCSMDIKDFPPWQSARTPKRTCKNNPLDLATSAGFALLNLKTLRFVCF